MTLSKKIISASALLYSISVNAVADTPQKKHEDQTLHQGDWTYDLDTKTWIKNKEQSSNDIPTTNDDDGTEQTEKTFWQKFNLGFSIGTGASFIKNSMQNLNLIKHNSNIFIQTNNNSKIEGRQINWPIASYTIYNNDEYAELAKSNPSTLIQSNNSESAFSTTTFFIPINIYADYRILDSLRFGLGFTVEAYKISVFEPTKDLSSLGPLDNQNSEHSFTWFMKPTFNVGYLFYKTENYDSGIYIKFGPVFNKGVGYIDNKKIDTNFITSKSIDTGLSIDFGLNFDFHINGHTTFTTQINYNFKNFYDSFDILENSGIATYYNQIDISLGFRFSFAENDYFYD